MVSESSLPPSQRPPLDPSVNQLNALHTLNGHIMKPQLTASSQLRTDLPSDFHVPKISYVFLISHCAIHISRIC
jgi:hypothetical protein